MINKNFEEFPEHRTNFFLLLQAVNSHCFTALLNIPPRQFKLVLDSIIWAVKHTMRNVADTGTGLFGKYTSDHKTFILLSYISLTYHCFVVMRFYYCTNMLEQCPRTKQLCALFTAMLLTIIKYSCSFNYKSDCSNNVVVSIYIDLLWCAKLRSIWYIYQ